MESAAHKSSFMCFRAFEVTAVICLSIYPLCRGLTADFAAARLVGVYEHFYDNNRFNEASYGTHYVALGYEIGLVDVSALASDDQHSELDWWDEGALLHRTLFPAADSTSNHDLSSRADDIFQ